MLALAGSVACRCVRAAFLRLPLRPKKRRFKKHMGQNGRNHRSQAHKCKEAKAPSVRLSSLIVVFLFLFPIAFCLALTLLPPCPYPSRFMPLDHPQARPHSPPSPFFPFLLTPPPPQ